jgi:nucleotide-binding universal stress UspA family protein
LHLAADLARRYGAHLTLVRVYDVPVHDYAMQTYGIGDLLARLRAQADEELTVQRDEALALGAPAVDTLTLHGLVADEILRAARDDGSDLIVLGTHGRTGIRHALLGSVAERVLRLAPCPVLVARATHDAAARAP